MPARLTLDEAVRLLRERGLDLLLAEAAVAGAEGDVSVAGAVPNPVIGLSYGRSHPYGGCADAQGLPVGCGWSSDPALGASISDQTALSSILSGKRGLRLDVARAALAAARLSRADAERTLVSQVKQQFVQVLLAQEAPALRTARVRCVLENPDGALKPEMYATVSIATEPKRALSVSRHALTRISEQTFVFVQVGWTEEGRRIFERRLVRVAEDDEGDHVSVLEGLTPGERVVVEGSVGRETADDEARLTLRQIESAGIQVAPVADQDLEDAVTVGGRLVFDDLRITHVFSPVTGRITRVLAQPGQRLKKGAPLVAIASPDVGSAVSDLGPATVPFADVAEPPSRQVLPCSLTPPRA